MTRGAADALLARVWAELRRDPGELEALAPLPEAPLPARLDVSGLVVASVAAASLAPWAGAAPAGSIRLDGDRIANAVQSERVARFGGAAPEVWSPLSGFRRARDGWVRTHANYPHHAAALRRVLGLSSADAAEPALVDAAVARRSAAELATAVTAAGGMCVVVEPESPVADAALATRPLIDLRNAGEGRPAAGRRRTPSPASDVPRTAPLHGVRVLDLTRVIAGPVATRTLALLGADVLRIDPPSPAEPAWQHLDTGPGKRSALLDARTPAGRARLDELLAEADVVVLGYRPAAIGRLGLAPEVLAARHPGLVVAQLAAWGFDQEDAGRGGFDSLVQAASGIARIEGAPDAPGALPAQALDHATGYLMAAAITSLLRSRAHDGGSSAVVRMSLRRTAAELLRMPRTEDPRPARSLDEAGRRVHTAELVGPAGVQRIARPAIASPMGAMEWLGAPGHWGSDAPRWAE